MSSFYLNHQNSNNINENTNLHTLILMNKPNLATQFEQQQQLSNTLLHQQFTPTDGNNNITLYGYPQEEAREVSRARQGLSLSLSSDNHGVALPHGGHVSVLGSKYLRVAQELLEQVVNVAHISTTPTIITTSTATADGHSPPSQESEKHGSGSTQFKEIQIKKAKLVTMLDEAEQRYRHYSTQMQMVIDSFERAAGIGSAKTYTALALKTISKQFRCLKEAIQSQIRAASKSLGEDYEGGGAGSSEGKIQGSRLKFIDHQIRQQRALQQLGVIPNHNAWRPQRGLPERSVSVLRAWLFEHFLHPYPKDSDKILLAKQTGLTRSQVSNWFINARVRLWKPMIEDMYNEELKDREQNDSEEKSKKNDDINEASNSVLEQESTNTSETQVKSIKLDQQTHNQSFMSIPQHGFTLNGSLEMAVISQGSPKRQRSNEMLNNNNNVYPIISSELNFIGGELGTYPNMGDLGRLETEEFSTPRFLSLGLPFSENQHQQFNDISSTNHATFMSPTQNMHHFRRGNDFASMNSPSSQSPSAAFECIDIQNQKRFSAQLEPDFVA